MRHFTSRNFWEHYYGVPKSIRVLAKKNYRLLKENPQHPSLHFKKIGKYWSVRIGIHYRAMAVELDGDMHWFWIGTHAEYD